ncbi:DUF2332 domain-containing protein [Streptacidiphilus sp. EB129]|uniref:DUF2332 domain-containing protein n=1 Tax=Streptacidiphilus sp. EB129 TaxID=3156262 RepID=UPI0035127869
MSGEESRERAARLVEWQAEACAELGSRLSAELLLAAAADVRAGGPCADALAGYEDAPGMDAIALRLLGAVHGLVLTGRAPELARYYPTAGGAFTPDQATEAGDAFRAAVAAELPWVRDWMTRPPQTNEVGRANLLIAGLLRATGGTPLPLRLFELGASAGLNLRPERFRYTAQGADGAEGFAWGDPGSPVLLANGWTDGAPGWLTAAAAERPELTVVERQGCDLTPIDPLSPHGALALRAYVWADQADRHARLEGALRLAAALPSPVVTCGAAEFLAGVELKPGTLTVVWHSVMRQYVPAEEWARVDVELDRLAAASTPEAPFAHIAFEPVREDHRLRFRLTVREGAGERVLLAESAPHGLPARAF